MPRPASPSDLKRNPGVPTRTLTPTEEHGVPKKGPPDYAVYRALRTGNRCSPRRSSATTARAALRELTQPATRHNNSCTRYAKRAQH